MIHKHAILQNSFTMLNRNGNYREREVLRFKRKVEKPLEINLFL